jgi:hypothetical protein
MKKVLGGLVGLAGGVIGAGVGRAAYVFAGGMNALPDPKKSPRLAGFVSDAFLVMGVVPGVLIGGAVGQWIGADPVVKKA